MSKWSELWFFILWITVKLGTWKQWSNNKGLAPWIITKLKFLPAFKENINFNFKKPSKLASKTVKQPLHSNSLVTSKES